MTSEEQPFAGPGRCRRPSLVTCSPSSLDPADSVLADSVGRVTVIDHRPVGATGVPICATGGRPGVEAPWRSTPPGAPGASASHANPGRTKFEDSRSLCDRE